MRKKAQERFWSYRQLPRDKAANACKHCATTVNTAKRSG
jgi:hypothetical protein